MAIDERYAATASGSNRIENQARSSAVYLEKYLEK
jgi:hypothetical protein